MTSSLFFQLAFEDPEVQGIYLLTDGKPVSLPYGERRNELVVGSVVQTLPVSFGALIYWSPSQPR